MTPNNPYSVRKFLLVSILATLLLISVISGIASWFDAQDEMNELYDHNLKQIADVIDAQHSAMNQSDYLTVSNEKKISGEEDYFVRIREKNGKTLYVSHPSIDLPISNKRGFSDLFYQNHKWKTFVKKSITNRILIDIAQVIDLRNATITKTATILVIPQLLTIPLLSLLIWLIVGRGLLPLTVLSQTIAGRRESLLSPVALDRAPAEIQPLVTALNTLLQRLDGTMRVLRQFTADAAHELRTPLTALKLQLVVLEQADTLQEREQAIVHLKAGVERAILLVQQLLTLARMEPDSAETPFVAVDLLSIVRQSVERLIALANKKNIDLGIDHSCAAMVIGDRAALDILVNNLIENAIRFTPQDGVATINITQEKEGIILEVADSGPGIPAHEQQRVFDRFYRGEGVMEPGTGLGLAIVKEITDRHNARILLGHADNLKGLSVKVIFQFY